MKTFHEIVKAAHQKGIVFESLEQKRNFIEQSLDNAIIEHAGEEELF